MYSSILVAIDSTPTAENRCAIERTEQIGKLTGASVHVLHVAFGHIGSDEITRGGGLGVWSIEDDIAAVNRWVVQQLVDKLIAAGVDAHGETMNVAEHDLPQIILQRADELDVDLLVLGHQHHSRSRTAERVIRQRPPYSILLARPRYPV